VSVREGIYALVLDSTGPRCAGGRKNPSRTKSRMTSATAASLTPRNDERLRGRGYALRTRPDTTTSTRAAPGRHTAGAQRRQAPAPPRVRTTPCTTTTPARPRVRPCATTELRAALRHPMHSLGARARQVFGCDMGRAQPAMPPQNASRVGDSTPEPRAVSSAGDAREATHDVALRRPPAPPRGRARSDTRCRGTHDAARAANAGVLDHCRSRTMRSGPRTAALSCMIRHSCRSPKSSSRLRRTEGEPDGAYCT